MVMLAPTVLHIDYLVYMARAALGTMLELHPQLLYVVPLSFNFLLKDDCCLVVD